ncbi:MAG TPA: AAA family ATPase [Solirubrobacterales bacterium]|nr:AAA family ATPase [Solirubrobacterales bacterium]
MGLFNRATRHSGGHGGGPGPATEGRESRDTDLGAELAELGELVPERNGGSDPSRSAHAPEGSDPSEEAHTSDTVETTWDFPEAAVDTPVEAEPDVMDELEAVEETAPEEVEIKTEQPSAESGSDANEAEEPESSSVGSDSDAVEPEDGPPSAGSGSDAVETVEPARNEVPDPTVAAGAEAPAPTVADDPDAGRISFEDALSPRRGAISAAVPSFEEHEPEKPTATAKVISFANQKGGVAKTTTTLNLAVAFAESGYRVLCVDLDPQGNLTMSQGIDPDKVEKSMYDVLVHHIPLSEVIQKREIDIAVASIDLAGAEIAMSTQIGRERSLEKAIRGVENDYDFVCIDTPPSLGLLTVNALTASNSVVIPVQCEYLSMRGLMQLQNTLEMIRENLNPKVQVEGILPTMLDSRTVHAKEAVELLEENFGDLVFKSRIRKAIKFAEAPVRGASVLKYDPQSNAADYYRELAKEVLSHGAT